MGPIVDSLGEAIVLYRHLRTMYMMSIANEKTISQFQKLLQSIDLKLHSTR